MLSDEAYEKTARTLAALAAGRDDDARWQLATMSREQLDEVEELGDALALYARRMQLAQRRIAEREPDPRLSHHPSRRTDG